MTTPGFDPMGMETPLEDLEALAQLAARSSGSYAVEVGSWAGRTALVLATYFNHVFCVDDWEGSPWEVAWRPWTPKQAFQAFCRNMGERLFWDVYPCVGKSLTWASVWNQPCGLVYLDADHRYEAVKADILAWRPHVAPGGILALHDYGEFPGVTRAVDELLPDRKLVGHCIAYVTVGDPP